ncbi:MAG TPA: Sec-independent protein translocase protein TatB [Gammaproteobacteria bacterium]|jgi:sec-independent protein translocase protein TatB
MFDVGFSELVLLFVIGLLVLGPERLPKVATQLGRWVGRARRTASQLRHQLEREIALSEIEQSRKRKESNPPPASGPSKSATEPPKSPASPAADPPKDPPQDPPVSG